MFVIDGKEYPIAGIETFNLDEAMVMYQYTGMTLDQVIDVEGMHPGMVAALLHVGMAREDPTAKAKDIEKAVRSSNLFDLINALAGEVEEGEVADPPSLPLSEPPEQPETEPAPDPSGEDSTDDGPTLQEVSVLPDIGSRASAMG